MAWNGVGEAASLGAALSSVARHLTESSGIPVHVTLDERETRLRPEVEAELFRIAQQAMTNAVRHSGAGMIDVEFDDRKYTGSHYGHICRAQVRLNSVAILDERDGGMKNDIREMRTMTEQIAIMQGAHQLAQKSTSTTLPR